MTKTILLITALATASVLTACGGGGGGSSSGGTYVPPSGGGSYPPPTGGGSYPPPSSGGSFYSHAELAAEFSKRLNTEVSGYEVTLVKTNTQQASYIVVHDKSYNTYDAYYVGAYTPGENMASYLNRYENKFYYDLIPEGYNMYRDFVTGKLFEIESTSSMNLDQIAAIQEMAAVNSAAKKLRETYGMSEEAALETAAFGIHLSNAPAGSIDTKAMDRFAKKLTGSTITQFQNDIKAGNSESLSERIELAKQKTGLSDDGIQKLFLGN